MLKGLDLTQRQMIETIDGYPTGNVYIGLTSEELAELEKELKNYEDFKKTMKDYDLKPSNLRQACIVFRMNKDRLKALDIIKEKIVDLKIFYEVIGFEDDVGLYNKYFHLQPHRHLIQDEFDLLKEVLIG